MKIGLIGCGRVGLTIGYLLQRKKLLYGIYDEDERALKKAKRILEKKFNPPYEKMVEDSDVLLFATPDDEILNAYDKAKPFIKGKKYIFHFSGLLPAEIFPRQRLVYRGSIHPFAPFPRVSIPPRQKKYILHFQGERQCLNIARKIFTPPNFLIRTIEKRNKPLYHLLGVFSSNLFVALFSAIIRMAKALHWRERDFKRVIIPMFVETINNLNEYGIEKGLSGPLVRGDLKTIKEHLKILRRYPALYDIYVSLSRMLIKYAPKKDQKELQRILKVD